MVYEVRARFFFTDPDEANDFHHDCVLAHAKATIVNPGTENEEPSIIALIENHHDEDPNGPCSMIQILTNAT